MSIADKLKYARNFLGKTQLEMAEAVGKTKGGWQTYEKGSAVPGGNVFKALSDLGFNASWFFNDNVPMLLDEAHRSSPSPADGDYVHIPRFEVAASAGGGAMVHSEQIVDYLSFRADWVRSVLGVSVGDLALISVIGDSMEPSLSEGDVVLLDMTTRSVLDGSIYALQLNGGLLVKRIQRMLDGSLVVKSDNARYDTEIVSEENAERLKIIGRVVWVGRRL